MVPYLVKVVKKLPLSSNLAVAFPDEGAHKRFHSFIEDWPMITCIKVREGDKRIVKVKEGRFGEAPASHCSEHELASSVHVVSKAW